MSSHPRVPRRRIGASRPGAARVRAHQAGFTLIEVLVAMFVFAIGAMGMAGAMGVAASADTHAGEQIRALALATQRLEELKALPFDEVRSEPAQGLDARGEAAAGPYQREVAVEDGAEGLDTKGVRVIVTYGSGGGRESAVDLYTLFYAGS